MFPVQYLDMTGIWILSQSIMHKKQMGKLDSVNEKPQGKRRGLKGSFHENFNLRIFNLTILPRALTLNSKLFSQWAANSLRYLLALCAVDITAANFVVALTRRVRDSAVKLTPGDEAK